MRGLVAPLRNILKQKKTIAKPKPSLNSGKEIFTFLATGYFITVPLMTMAFSPIGENNPKQAVHAFFISNALYAIVAFGVSTIL